MNVHNILEEQVISCVNNMYDQLKKNEANWLTCDCEQCRLDTCSYVLNRIPPKYVVSGRGAVHNMSKNDIQLKADIDAMVIEGMHAVNRVSRPFHNNPECRKPFENGPFFNFPAFVGTVYDGTSFAPLKDASITLKQGTKVIEMIDYTWQNPYKTTPVTKGVFSFLAKPEKSEKAGENKIFNFTLEIRCDGYEKLEYNFEVPVISEDQAHTTLNSVYTVKLQDICLFPEGPEEGDSIAG